MKNKPKTVGAAFNQFDEELNLDPAERKAAQRRHQQISKVLGAAGLAETTFLQGSFARKTMLKPLKDVDMVIVLPEKVAAQLRRPGGPQKAMDMVRHAVRQKFPDAKFDPDEPAAHALQVVFPDCTFTFDLVPAYTDLDGTEAVFIANREEDCWEWSNARRLNRVVSERNQQTDGQFVHQVRQLKSFKTYHPVLDDTDGLLWEALAYATITTRQPHQQAVADTIRHAATALAGPVYDPTEEDDLTAKWTDRERIAYITAVSAAARDAAEARRLEGDDEHNAAIEIWYDLLGDPFPPAPPQSADDALRSLGGGSITSRGRAVPSQRGNQPVRPGRSWRQR